MSPPRMRGSTSITVIYRAYLSVSPAHAGIDPR